MSALICSVTILINVSNLKWNSHDKDIQKQASKRCGELYSKSPCLKKFIKYDFNSYQVICGATIK